MGMMGTKAPSMPVTKMDKMMHARHDARRAKFDDAPPTLANLRKSAAYNEDHAKEHAKQAEKMHKEVAKAEKKAAKARGK